MHRIDQTGQISSKDSDELDDRWPTGLVALLDPSDLDAAAECILNSWENVPINRLFHYEGEARSTLVRVLALAGVWRS